MSYKFSVKLLLLQDDTLFQLVYWKKPPGPQVPRSQGRASRKASRENLREQTENTKLELRASSNNTLTPCRIILKFIAIMDKVQPHSYFHGSLKK